MVKPNFFIIGAPKCGTTALAQYLSEHPHVYFCPGKEPHYFAMDTNGPSGMNLKTYLSLFAAADPLVHQAVGEGSTSYLFSDRAVPEILRFNPDAKFIVMLRDPLDQVQALHSQYVFEGLENIKDFEEAWRAQERGQGLFQYLERGKLGSQFERLLGRVRKGALKVILLEDFTADPAKVYAQTLAFLGLQPDGRKVFQKINENKKVLWPGLQALFGFLSQAVIRLKNEWGITRGLGLVPFLLELNSRVEKRKGISENFLAELRNHFGGEVGKLSRQLGRDLSHWTGKKLKP